MPDETTNATEPTKTDEPKKTTEERLAELRAAKDAKLKKLQNEAEHNELELLELEAKWEGDAGVRGIDFDILDLAVRDKDENFVGRLGAPIVLVRSQSSILHRQFTSGKITDVTTYNYVKPHVKSDLDEFRRIVDAHPTVATRCANKLVDLYGAKTEERAGK